MWLSWLVAGYIAGMLVTAGAIDLLDVDGWTCSQHWQALGIVVAWPPFLLYALGYALFN